MQENGNSKENISKGFSEIYYAPKSQMLFSWSDWFSYDKQGVEGPG